MTLHIGRVAAAIAISLVAASATRAQIPPAAISRMLVPDGSSAWDGFTMGAEKWYSVGVEPGRTYVVEAFDVASDYGASNVASMLVYDIDGTSAPPEATVACNAAARTPAIDRNHGHRCIVRTMPPSPSRTLNKRSLFIDVLPVSTSVSEQFTIRVRDATVFGRWTTNGYDFHVEVQNATRDPVCAEIQLYPKSGTSYNGPAPLVAGTLNVPAYGAQKVVVPAGTLVNGDATGTMRVNACAGSENLGVASVNVSTYAFNPVTGEYLQLLPTTVNTGRGNTLYGG